MRIVIVGSLIPDAGLSDLSRCAPVLGESYLSAVHQPPYPDSQIANLFPTEEHFEDAIKLHCARERSLTPTLQGTETDSQTTITHPRLV